MPQAEPKLEQRRSRKTEVKDYYIDRSKYGSREITGLSKIHDRHKSLIERIVSIWDEDKQKNGKPYTGFQNRLIELHNNADKFGSDVDDSKRLFMFLSTFGETGYDDAGLNELTQGTFTSQAEVDDLLARAFTMDKKWKAEYGKLSLKKEGDPTKLAELTREELAKDEMIFRANLVPHSQFEWANIGFRFEIHMATKYRLLDISPELKQRIKSFELSNTGVENVAKFNIYNPKQLLQFIEEGTSANLENVLKQGAENIKSSQKINIAREKGYKDLADACDEKNLDRLHLNGPQRHQEIVNDINSIEDLYKWIYSKLNVNNTPKFEAFYGAALNDPAIYELLINRLGLPAETSPTKLFETISLKNSEELNNLVDGATESAIVNAVKNGPWYLKVDVAHSLLNRRLEEVSGASEILPKIENFEQLDLSGDEVTFHHAATLMAHGFKRQQLIQQGMAENKIDQAITTFFKHDENGKFLPDANGNPQFKDAVDTDDFKDEIHNRQDLNQYEDDAKDEIKGQLTNNDREVLEQYETRAIVQAREDARDYLIANGVPNPTDANVNANLSLHLPKYWYNGKPVPSHPNHQTWIAESKTYALDDKKISKKVRNLQEQMRDNSIAEYKQQHIDKAEMDELSTVQLATLQAKGKINRADNVSPHTVNQINELVTNANNITPAKLESYIKSHASTISGPDLAILLSLFDTIPQALASQLTPEQQQQFAEMAG